ncbi:Chitin-binding protein [Pseudomonas caricapapayae]|uniref:Chitin-binding protein n=1 Tax=Pseudomonas caricapapayae TaxID=46678 RepID=A0A3M6FDC3_9PSED|nr:lytic polysaccharide monooxygenase auxiliary activity family 9 protein [Pseudomonas caricapapayae]RMV78661.1 Chitin-binding protein [Pseudomonas caricapapayae]
MSNLDSNQDRHGRVISPATRGSQLMDLGVLGEWQDNELEGGKNFPSTEAGDFPGYPTDTKSNTPPADGVILRGGKADDARKYVNYTDQEFGDEFKKLNPGKEVAGWKRHDVAAGADFRVEWKYAAPHVTRGYLGFITKDGWDETTRITRDHLESEPFYEDLYTQVPFDQHKDELKAKTALTVKLPSGKQGHHIVLLLWIIADTGAAFYQTFDVDFK